MSQGTKEKSKPFMEDLTTIKSVEELIIDFKRKSNNCENLANTFLAAIIVILCVGIVLYVAPDYSSYVRTMPFTYRTDLNMGMTKRSIERYDSISEQFTLDTVAYNLRKAEYALDRLNPVHSQETFNRYMEIEKLTMVNTISIRVGVVVIVLFLLQILFRNFRYNKRIANFYKSRAQSLEYCEMKGGKLEDALKFFNTDMIDVGISKAPTDSILSIAKSS